MSKTQIIKHAIRTKRPCYLVRIIGDWRLITEKEFEIFVSGHSDPENIAYREIQPTDYQLARATVGVTNHDEFLEGMKELAEMEYESY